MATITVSELEFHHSSPFTPVFSGLDLSIDTSWRTAIVGRNGRGKTTLLRLIHGDLRPTHGRMSVPIATIYFPSVTVAAAQTALEVVKEQIAPFREWERRMEELLAVGDESSLAEYGDILERYQACRGYEIDGLIERELALLNLSPDLLNRDFDTLSGGERTRALIAGLFLAPERYPLIDEPTNHLDMAGREFLADYLASKEGFLLVSHDRSFLDRCVDHVISINRGDVRLHKGSYSRWKEAMEIEEEFESRKETNLRREIHALEEVAQKRRSWSAAREKTKNSAPDSGYEGHKAAKIMKRALHAERRVEEMIEEKSGLLCNREEQRALKLPVERAAPEVLLSIDRATVELGGKVVVRDFSLTVRKGERIALVGPNGSGKTTLLRIIAGEPVPLQGIVYLPGFLTVARAYQIPLWTEGFLRDHLREVGLDETKFRQVMGRFGVWGEIFDRPLESFSQGQRKKVDLCRSFLAPSHLLLWDEPMNYIDLMSREQIEQAVLDSEPTMLFVEHDRRFVDQVATSVVVLNPI